MKRLLQLTALLVTALVAVPVSADDAPPLTAAQILDRHVAETGGKAAYEKMQTLVLKAQSELLPDGKLRSEVVKFAQRPNLLRVEQRIDRQNVVMVRVYDGKLGWTQDSLNGFQRLEGVPLEELRREAVFNDLANWRTTYPKVSLKGVETVGDRPCYVVELDTSDQAASRLAYFDRETFLLRRLDSTKVTRQGAVKLVTLYKVYKEVAGVLICYQYEQQTPIGTVVIKVNDVKVNSPLPDGIFALPKAAGDAKPPRVPSQQENSK